MTLLNGLLAFGALAFSIPLVIHLLFRSRFRTVDWGAMHLLDSVVRINRRRIQLMNLLLLLLRCLLPILLAFCLARPVLTGFRSLPGDAPQSLVLVIDDSRSMTARDQTAVSRLDRAKKDLAELLASLSRRDEVMLIRSSAVDMPPATMGATDAAGRLRQLTADGGPVDLAALVRAGVEAAGDASHPQRRVLIVSDFQSNLVGDGTLQSLDRFQRTVSEQPTQPAISFLNYGRDSEALANVSVESIAVDSPAVVAGRSARFSARIRNASDTAVRDLRVTWSVAGKPLESRTVSITPRSTATVRLSRLMDVVGVHEIGLSVEHADSLLSDNRRSIAVDVIREIHVLLVDGKPSNRPLEGETDFLAIALSPFAFGGEDQPDAVRTSVTNPQGVTKSLNQDLPDILVLANVQRLTDEARRAVSQYVLAGGALVIFDGETIDTEHYNENWQGDSDHWSLPARLGDFVGAVASAKADPLPLGAASTQYSPWSVLGSADEQPFAEVDVYGYRKLSIADQTSEAAPVKLLSMANGDPLILMARRGKGQVVQFAVTCDADWTTLPMRMVYLPMMQQLVLDLAGSRKQTTAVVGSGFSVATAELAALIPDTAKIDSKKRPTFTIEPPGQAEVAIEPTDEASPQLLIAATTKPGVYRLRQVTPSVDGNPIVTTTLRVVDVPAIESQLREVDPQRLAGAAESIEASVFGDVKSLQSDDRTRRFGREIWRWLLAVLLVGMIGELFLQQRSLRRPVVLGAS